MKAKIILDFERQEYKIIFPSGEKKLSAFTIEVFGKKEEFIFRRGGETKQQQRQTSEKMDDTYF